MDKSLKTLTVVCERYPTEREPVFTFVDDLACALARLGVQITVVSPQSLTRVALRGGHLSPRRWMRKVPDGASFPVLQPYYLSFGSFLSGLGQKNYRRAVKRALKKLPAPDAVYAHFWTSGVPAAQAAPGGRKVFVGCGESTVRAGLAADVKKISGALGGVISVSGKNKEDCVRLYGLEPKAIEVFPNGVDETLFKRRDDRAALRRALSLTDDDFAVAFVGWFDERKGVKRVEAALRGLPGVRVIYIGHGDQQPEGDNIAFCGRAPHEDIPRYLNAADAFVLPTRAEGCCNAIVEAMACGLPIISSTGAFNDDLLREDHAIRVDPDDVPAIRDAVLALQGDPGRTRAMGEAALRFAEGLTVAGRARRIKEFIEERM